MEREIFFSVLAFIIVLYNTFIYWRGIFRGEIIPHPFTMFIWVVVLFIGASELISQDEYI